MLNDKLKLLRKQRGVSQEGLAEQLAVTRQAVTKWESGLVIPDIFNLLKISEIFNVSIDYLVKEDDECQVEIDEKTVDKTGLTGFVYEAKMATYAANGQQDQLALRQASKDYRFKKNDDYYHDSYVGNQTFIGEELVYKGEQPVWGLAYSGKVLADTFSSRFLKESLLLVSEDLPIRGPIYYSQGSYHYHCEVDGDFEWFRGTEGVYYEQKKVFELHFHGGLLD